MCAWWVVVCRVAQWGVTALFELRKYIFSNNWLQTENIVSYNEVCWLHGSPHFSGQKMPFSLWPVMGFWEHNPPHTHPLPPPEVDTVLQIKAVAMESTLGEKKNLKFPPWKLFMISYDNFGQRAWLRMSPPQKIYYDYGPAADTQHDYCTQSSQGRPKKFELQLSSCVGKSCISMAFGMLRRTLLYVCIPKYHQSCCLHWYVFLWARCELIWWNLGPCVSRPHADVWRMQAEGKEASISTTFSFFFLFLFYLASLWLQLPWQKGTALF